MDPTFLINLALFALLLGNSFDLFSSSDSDTEDDPDPAEHPLYIPGDYDDPVAGSTGNDTIAAAPEDGGPEDDGQAWFLDTGDDSLTGSAGNDYADGGDGNDTLFMNDGDDRVSGGAGNDLVDLGAGNDSLLAGTGDDSILGGTGNDAINGEAGNDTLLGGEGADLLIGGEGDDVLSGYEADRSEAEGATGATTGATTGIDGFDTLSGGAGNDTLLLGLGDRGEGGEGDDLFQIDRRSDGLDQIAQVTDFSDGDRLQLIYTPVFDASGQEIPPEINVSANEEGTAGIIRFGDLTVAQVIGGQNLTAEDVEMIRDSGA